MVHVTEECFSPNHSGFFHCLAISEHSIYPSGITSTSRSNIHIMSLHWCGSNTLLAKLRGLEKPPRYSEPSKPARTLEPAVPEVPTWKHVAQGWSEWAWEL